MQQRRAFTGKGVVLSPLRGVLGLALSVVLVFGLADCRSLDEAVDTLAVGGKTPGLPATAAETAAAMADCLNKAGVETVVYPADEQPVSIGPEPHRNVMIEYPVVQTGKASSVLMGSVTVSTPQWLIDEWEQMRSNYHDGDALLFVEQEDLSSVFAACLEETGYSPPAPGVDAESELKEKRAVADAGVLWAQCARDNGFPSIRDPDPPIADGWLTQPAVMVPFTVDPTKLRELVLACPPFDRQAHEEYDDWGGTNAPENERPVDPVIEYDLSADPDLETLSDEAIQKQADRLNAIIWEDSNRYYQGK
ncbi:MAG: hypothetical protein FWG16_06520 [Micrococcales bacterium]|nr:hypothetical protein [Micrococcales bacterium]